MASATSRLIESALGVKVEKGSLTNLDDAGQDASRPFLFNPTELEENYGGRWARLDIPGLSYQPLQYLGGQNPTFPLTLYVDQLAYEVQRPRGQRPIVETLTDTSDAEEYRRFLVSLSASRPGETIAAHSPPPVLFTWPGMISMRVRVLTVRLRHLQFQSGSARARIYTADIMLEEDAQGRITNQDVLARGMFRPWAAGANARR